MLPLPVPSRSLQEQSMYIDAISWWFLSGVVFQNIELKPQQVNRNGVFPGVVLFSTRQESLDQPWMLY